MICDTPESGLQAALAVLSISSIVLAQGIYLVKLSRKTKDFKPTVISWLGWAVLMGISFISQVEADCFTIKLVALLISSIGCLVIAFSARFIHKHYTIKKEDWYFFYTGIAVVLVYLLFEDQWSTNIIAILADLIFAIPLIKNANRNPEAEKVSSWIVALVSWVFTLVLVTFDFTWISALWPIYLILFSATLTYLTYIKPHLSSNTKG